MEATVRDDLIPRDERIPTMEKWMYGIGGLGQNIIYVVVSSFLMFFLTDVYGISPMATGTMLMIGRIWDGLNDPLMGFIVEGTRTRWGKLRPYLLFCLVPVALFTTLSFLGPDFASPTMRLVWCYAMYFFWDLAYTMSDIPYWGLSAAMTSNTEERTKLLTMTRVLTMVGMAVGVIGIPILIGALGGATTPEASARIPRAQNKAAYTNMALICSLVGCGLLSLAFFGTRERTTSPEAEKTSFKKSVSTILRNVPLMLVLLASILGFGRLMSGVAGMYVCMWVFKSTNYYALLGGVSMAATVIAIMLTPAILKKTSKKKLFIYSSLADVAIYAALYIVGKALTRGTWVLQSATGIYVCLGFLFFASFAGGFFTILQTVMIGDSVDYLEWKTGVRAEGLCFAGQTFVTKICAALCTFVFGVILTVTGYIAQGATLQSQRALAGIFQSVTLWPALSCALSIVPILWYDLDDNRLKGYMAEVKKRRAG